MTIRKFAHQASSYDFIPPGIPEQPSYVQVLFWDTSSYTHCQISNVVSRQTSKTLLYRYISHRKFII